MVQKSMPTYKHNQKTLNKQLINENKTQRSYSPGFYKTQISYSPRLYKTAQTSPFSPAIGRKFISSDT